MNYDNNILNKIVSSFFNDLLPSGNDRFISRGVQYFKNGSIKSFSWNPDGSTLTAIVEGTDDYIIQISDTKRKNLKLQCSCPARDSYSFCKHIVCALAAVQYFLNSKNNVLNGKTFAYDNQKFKNQLLNVNSDISIKTIEEKDFSLHVLVSEYDIDDFEFVVKNGDDIIEYINDFNYIPEELYPFFNNYEYIDFPFINILNDGIHPVYIHTSTKNIQVSWNKDFFISPKIEINIISNDTVNIRRFGVFNGMSFNNLIRVGQSFILDIETKMLGRIRNPNDCAWDYFDKFEYEFFESINDEEYPEFSKSLTISADNFNKKTVLYNAKNTIFFDDYIFKNQGIVVSSFEKTSPNFQVNVSSSENAKERMTLENSIIVHDKKILQDENLFSRELWPYNSMPNNITSPRQKTIIKNNLFALSFIKNTKELKTLIENTVEEVNKRSRKKKTGIKSYLRSFYKNINQGSWKCIIIHNEKFYMVEIPNKKTCALIAIQHLVFSKYYEFNIDNNKTRVYMESVYEGLPLLKKLLDEQKIPLFFDTMPVKSSNIDIRIDASKHGDFDWFEIKPDIYENGKKVSDKDWKSIVSGNKIRKGKNFVQIVDENTQSIIDSLLKFLSPNDKEKKKDKKHIVSIPRLKIFDMISLRKKGIKIKFSDQDESIIQNLYDFKTIKNIPIPKDLHCTLRDYQKNGYDWLAFLYKHKFGACLADDMGLGKTVQAIAFLAGIFEGKIKSTFNNKKTSHLIVVPPSLVFNWTNEIETFYPNLKTTDYIGETRKIDFENIDIIITTYDIIRRDIEKLKKIHFDVIIFDEAQAIKNIFSQRATASRQLNGNFKICITGTPLENHIGEYYSIMDLALPGLLPKYREFQKNVKDGEYLNNIIIKTKPFMLRRTKKAILNELPEKTESDVYLTMTERQKTLYTKIASDVRSTIDQAYQSKTKSQAGIIALTALLRLRQICVSPALILDKEKSQLSPKLNYLINKLKEITQENHAALVFSQFTSCLDLIEEALKKENLPYLRIDGKTPLIKRKVIISAFQKEHTVPILLMSLKTGGVGLNLTRASYVFHVDPWWNAAVENQASDRIYRIGQKNKVFVIRLLMHHSIEEKMMKLKKKKYELFTSIIEGIGRKNKNKSISKSDFNFLLE